jgi:hypothetical protein
MSITWLVATVVRQEREITDTIKDEKRAVQATHYVWRGNMFARRTKSEKGRKSPDEVP